MLVIANFENHLFLQILDDKKRFITSNDINAKRILFSLYNITNTLCCKSDCVNGDYSTFNWGGGDGLNVQLLPPSIIPTKTCNTALRSQTWKTPLLWDSGRQKHPLQCPVIHINEWLKQNTISFSLYNIKNTLSSKSDCVHYVKYFPLTSTF